MEQIRQRPEMSNEEVLAAANARDRAACDNWFTYHPPEGDEAERYARIRAAGRAMAGTLLELCPPSADRTVALRKLREVVYTANASIACKGR